MQQGLSNTRGVGMKGQIVIPIALLMVLTLGATGVLGYRASFRALDRAHLETLASESRRVSSELENTYRGYERAVAFLANNDPLARMIALGEYESASEFLAGFTSASPELESVFVASAHLESMILANGVDDEWNSFRLAGTSYSENIRKALVGESWTSGPRRSPMTDVPVVLMSAPVTFDGRPVGVLGLSVDMRKLSEQIMAAGSFGATGYPMVTTPDGVVIAHPDTENILETNLGYFDWGDDVLAGAENQMIRYRWHDTDRVLVLTRSDDYSFVSMATIELRDLRTDGLSLGWIFAIVGFTGLLLTIAIAVFILFTKIKPITAAVEIANRIALGDFNVDKLEVTARDEMWALAEALDRMVQSLSYKAGVLETIASGDLSGQVETASDVDVLGHSLAAMSESLNTVLTQVNDAIEQVASGSDQVAQASQSLSQGATEQASSLEQITSSLTEINGQSKKNVTFAEQGNDRMKNLLGAMEKINDSSDKIRQVVSVIDDIAFQINLLALNANVEAARAGKYGKGFAVVAEEVRNLAVRSATAVKETTTMVDETVRNIALGNELASETARQLEEVAMASREQAQGVDQINSGLEQIDHVTQANTASAEESASAAEELASQARKLKAMIARFKLAAAGGAAAPADFAARPFVDLSAEDDESPATGVGDLVGAGVVGNSARVNPSDIIKLDDEEFGDF